tara:strand:+ start:281 stop:700 length:420 start_codon:yes stop_codon:yes gene_type:complete
MIDKFILVLFFNTIVLCQDSLYWFDFNTLHKDIPKTAKVLDQIFEESQFLILDSIRNKMNSTKDGYRLQIHDDLTVINANKTLKKFKKILPDSLYIVFEAPFYKIRYGNYTSKKIAEDEKENLQKQGFKDIWIVKSRIN